MTRAMRRYYPHTSGLSLLMVMLVVTSLATPALAVPIDNIRLSRIAPVTTAEIELGCAMRYLHHAPASSGTELRIRMSLGIDCVNALRSTPLATHRPQGGRMAHLERIEFDSIAGGQAIITLRFEQPVAFEVVQTSN